jgi:hypothetical protein
LNLNLNWNLNLKKSPSIKIEVTYLQAWILFWRIFLQCYHIQRLERDKKISAPFTTLNPVWQYYITSSLEKRRDTITLCSKGRRLAVLALNSEPVKTKGHWTAWAPHNMFIDFTGVTLFRETFSCCTSVIFRRMASNCGNQEGISMRSQMVLIQCTYRDMPQNTAGTYALATS